MENNDNRKDPRELADEALGNVSGGAGDPFETAPFYVPFTRRNCYNCSEPYGFCDKFAKAYETYGGDPNAVCVDLH